jgi:hypothetical protein
MKKNTQTKITNMLRLLKRKQAHFFKNETDGKLYYTYPKKDGWMHEPAIDGKPLEYISAHDDGGLPLNKIYQYPTSGTPFRISPRSKPVLGKIKDLS